MDPVDPVAPADPAVQAAAGPRRGPGGSHKALGAALGAAGRADYAPMNAAVLSDSERWPTLEAAAVRQVHRLYDEPGAPVWTHRCGDRLTSADLDRLARLGERLRDGSLAQRRTGPYPRAALVDSVIRPALGSVPRYRALARAGRLGPGARLEDLPVANREDLRRDLASHVALDADLDRIVQGTSSGSTGAAIRFPVDPLAPGADVVLLRWWLERLGVSWELDALRPERLALVQVVDQGRAFTYASAMTAHGPGARMARINLDPAAWTAPDDPARWLARHDPLVLSSAPLPLLRLADTAPGLRPRAVVSGTSHLSARARTRLERTWEAPVLDVYGLEECGMVAVDPDGAGWRIVPGVHVEVLDAAGDPLPAGERGRLVVTTGMNPAMPLLRYDTGDRGSVASRHDPRAPGGAELLITALEGRGTVRYENAWGDWVPSVSLTQVLQARGAAVWSVHQRADGHLDVLAAGVTGTLGPDLSRELRAGLATLLGQPVSVHELADSHRSSRRFTSALPGHDGLD